MDLPARIGKYELQEFLGGGMSHVYKAQDTVLGRTVAVKILTESGCADPETKARFLQEARMAGNFSHDNIINVFDFGEEQGRPYIIMEFLRGETLKDAIKGSRTGDLNKKLDIALQLARALEYIHSKKIVHRDIKPDNVHIDTSGRVKLMDFGIAKSQNVALTRIGFTLGTPYYMAPEQVLGQQVTAQVDVYAWGIMMFEMLTGMKPISGESIDKVFQQVLNEPVDLEPLRARGVPEPLIDLIRRCTSKNAMDRPAGFTVICSELEAMLGGPVSGQGLLGQTSQQSARPAPTGPAPIPTGSRPSSFGRTSSAPPPAIPTSVNPPPPAVSTPAPPAPRPGTVPPPVARPAPPHPATPAAPARPAPAVQAARPLPPQPAAGADVEGLPDWILAFPPRFRTQTWFTAFSAVGVLAGMAAVIVILRLMIRLIF
jgi:serine/threonine protein kinase